METKVEFLGVSVAIKHIYFYLMLIAATLLAATLKDLYGGESERDRDVARLQEVSQTIRNLESLP